MIIIFGLLYIVCVLLCDVKQKLDKWNNQSLSSGSLAQAHFIVFHAFILSGKTLRFIFSNYL